MPHLDIKPEIALAKQKIKGLILLCHEDERPLKGILGKLDWSLNGVFSNLLKTQIISGKKGEAIYVPLLWNGITFHFLVMGAGNSSDPRPDFKLARKKMNELKLSDLAVLATDWKEKMDEEDPDLWILN